MILYLYIIFLLLCFFLTGHLVVFLCKIKEPANTYLAVFAKLFTGLVVFITVYSIIKTGGKTINLGFLLMGPALLYLFRKENLCLQSKYDFSALFKINIKNTLRIVFEILVLALAWYAFQCGSYEKLTYFIQKIDAGQQNDIVLYSKVSDYLNVTGSENSNNFNAIFNLDKGTSPYHYFELWLCAGVSHFFNILTYVAYLKIMVPLLLTIISLGLIAIFKNYFTTNYVNLLIPLLLFCHAVVFSFYPQEVSTFNRFPTLVPKTLPIYLGVLFFILFLRKNIPIAFIILSSVILMTIAAAIGIAGGIVLILFYLFFIKRTITKGTFYYILSYLLLLGVFICCFYLITASHEKKGYTLISVAYIIEHIKTPFHIYVKTILEILCIYAPYLFIAAYFANIRKKHTDINTLIKTTVAVFLSALLGWAIMFQMGDSVQLFNIPAIPFIILTIIYLLIILLFELRTHKKKLFLLLCLISVFIGTTIFSKYKWESTLTKRTYSVKYIDTIQHILTNNPINPVGISMQGKEDYVTLFDKNPSLSLGNYLNTLISNCNTVSISVFDTPIDSSDIIECKREHSLIETSVFYNYVSAQKQSGTFKTVEQAQMDFIKIYHIKYGLISKNAALSPSMQTLVTQTVTDSITGERFVVFK